MDSGIPDLESYDLIMVAFSGGKDSLACLLHLLDAGVPKEKIELQHHEIDGREGGHLMDWPSTPGYCRAVARALGVRLFFSWKEGGFEREMLRDHSATAPTRFESTGGKVLSAGGTYGRLGTRMRFPQAAADLRIRWCSAYLKIDVLDKVLVNDPRLQNQRILVVTGERAEESPGRAKYKTFEPHRVHAPSVGRHVDHWRPVHGWKTANVWAIIKRHGIEPHPAYRLGWGRLSCLACIFGSRNQWATVREFARPCFNRIAAYEQRFGCTIDRKLGVAEKAGEGEPYQAALENPALVATAMSTVWKEPVITSPGAWVLPAGAFGENSGPS